MEAEADTRCPAELEAISKKATKASMPTKKAAAKLSKTAASKKGLFPVGKTVGITQLKSAYDEYFVLVIGDRLEGLDRGSIQVKNAPSRRRSARFKVVKEL